MLNTKEPEQDDLRLKDVSGSWLAGHILKIGCFTLLIFAGLLIGLGIIFGDIEDRARLGRGYAQDCVSRLSHIGKVMYSLVDPDGKVSRPYGSMT